MRLSDLMASPVETLSIDAAVDEARAAMRRLRIHHVVVMDGRRIAGVVSSRDLATKAADAAANLGELVGGEVVVADPHMTTRQAANLLRGRAVGSLPVVDRGKLVGIVTISDLLELVGKGAERPVEMGKRWTLRHRGPRRKQGPI